MSDQTYMVEKGVLVRLRFRTANFTEPHELTEDEALLTDARVVMASMLAELEVAKAREEAWVQFAQHHHSCAGRMPKSLDAPWRKCTCGLDALKLAAWRSRQGRRGRETDTGTRLAGRDR